MTPKVINNPSLNKTTLTRSNIEFGGEGPKSSRNNIKLEPKIFSETPKAVFMNKITPFKGSTAKLLKSESQTSYDNSRKQLNTANFGQFTRKMLITQKQWKKKTIDKSCSPPPSGIEPIDPIEANEKNY